MNIETLIAYVVGLLSTLVCGAVFYLFGMAHGISLEKAERKEVRDER